MLIVTKGFVIGKWRSTLCLLGFVSTTPKARMVIEGRTAIQVVKHMVSQTSGVL